MVVNLQLAGEEFPRQARHGLAATGTPSLKNSTTSPFPRLNLRLIRTSISKAKASLMSCVLFPCAVGDSKVVAQQTQSKV
jgi:hypothetical protein